MVTALKLFFLPFLKLASCDLTSNLSPTQGTKLWCWHVNMSLKNVTPFSVNNPPIQHSSLSSDPTKMEFRHKILASMQHLQLVPFLLTLFVRDTEGTFS